MAACRILLAALVVVGGVQAQMKLTRTYDRDSNFFDQFYWRDRAYFERIIGTHDPTFGAVDYVSQSTALSSGLAAYRGDRIYLGADNATVVPSSSPGRRSVRLESKDTFDSGLLIADIEHMPGNACGVWPAFWTYNFAEDPISEIDIIEGTGWTRQSANTVSLHSCGTCSFPSLAGEGVRKDCDMGGGSGCGSPTNYPGCGVDGKGDSFGDQFNDQDGGVYATLLDKNWIKIWHFRRSEIPKDITSGKPTPGSWPAPQASFKSGSSCKVPSIFKSQTIIINIDFCGSIIYDWDEQTAGHSECGASKGRSCEDFVRKNPGAFSEAYWLFNSIKLYQ